MTISLKRIIHTKLFLKKQYKVQQARRAYLASICQFEALFDFLYITQLIKFFSNNIVIINKQLEWQIDNKLQ